jgi:hypothetical protein
MLATSDQRLQKHPEADVRAAAVFLSDFLDRERHRIVRMTLRRTRMLFGVNNQSAAGVFERRGRVIAPTA